jgi:hypothetical protein
LLQWPSMSMEWPAIDTLLVFWPSMLFAAVISVFCHLHLTMLVLTSSISPRHVHQPLADLKFNKF